MPAGAHDELVYLSVSIMWCRMKIRFLASLLFPLVACSPSHPPAKSENTGNGNTNKYLSAGQIDSMTDARLGYFMKQIGDTAAFEKYYAKNSIL